MEYSCKNNWKSTTEGIMRVLNLDMEKEKCRKIYENSFQTKKYSNENDAYKELCLAFSVEPTCEKLNNLSKMFTESITSIDLLPNTITILEKLKNNNYKIGLISNSSESVIKIIKQNTVLLDYIDYPLFSFDCGIIKPNKEIFLKMLYDTKILPEESLMIGDSLIDDIEPTKSLGMHAIQFKNYEQLKKDLAIFKISI